MNKIPCEVIQDLMILYDDDSCSGESRKLVEEHIKNCRSCRELYEKTAAPLPDIQASDSIKDELSADEKAMNFLKDIKKQLSRRKLISVFLAAVILFMIVAGYQYFTIKTIPAPSKSVKVSELYQLKNGSIFCTLECDKSFTITSYSQILVPDKQWATDSDEGWYELGLDISWWRKLLPSNVQHRRISYVLPLQETAYDIYNNELMHKASAVYYIGKNPEDKLTVWKEGQDIKPAPKDIEQLVASEAEKRVENQQDSSEAHVIFYD